MTGKEAFGVVVRTIGLLLLLAWAFLMVVVVINRHGFDMAVAFVSFCIGAYFLKGAPVLVEWAYQEPRQTTPHARSAAASRPADGN